MSENLNIRVTANANRATNSMRGLINTVRGGQSTFDGNNRRLNRMAGAMRSLSTDANRCANGIRGLGNSFKLLNLSANIYLFARLGRAIGTTITASMDMIETVNLFNVSLGTMAEETDKYLRNISELSGLDLNNLREAVGTYTLLARSMGLTNEAAAKLGKNMTLMAVDLSSLVNVPFEQALADLRSGLVGQTETVYKYGNDLTEASLKAISASLGIEKSVRNMTQGEKMILRYIGTLKNGELAMNDFYYTIGQPANQLRLLKENFLSLGRAIGNAFIPILGKIVPYVRAVVMVLTDLFNIIAGFFGFAPEPIKNTDNAMSGIGDGLDDVSDKADKTKKKLKELQAPFDELNSISDNDDSGSGSSLEGAGGGISQELIDAMQEYDSLLLGVRQKANDIRDRLLDWLGITRKLNEETGEIDYGIKLGSFLDHIRNAIEDDDWSLVGKLIGLKLSYYLGKLNEFIKWENVGKQITEMVTRITDLINGFFEGFNWKLLGETIGNGFNTVLYTATLFLQQIDFSLIGKSMGELFQEAVNTIDWTGIGTFLASGVNGAIDYCLNFLKNFNISSLAQGFMDTFNEAVKKIKWKDLGEVIGRLIVQALDSLVTIILNLDVSALLQAIADLIVGVFKGAFEQLTGGSSPIGEGFKYLIESVFNWDSTKAIFDGALTKIKEGFKALCELRLLDAGGYIVEGIVDGIIGALGFFVEPIGDLFTYVYDAICYVFGIHSPAESMMPLGAFILSGIIEGFKSMFETFIETMNIWWDTTVAPWFTTDRWTELWETVKSVFVEGWNSISDWWKSSGLYIWWTQDVQPYFNLKTWTDMVAVIKNTLMEVWNNLVTWWQASALSKWFEEDVKKWFVKDTWVNAMSGIVDAFKEIFKGAVNAGISLVNQFITWLNEVFMFEWESVWVGGVRLLEAGEIRLINLKPIPMLARGGILEDGQQFVAGENGKSEMIGSYQGKTTVMPLENTGFVQAIHEAVFSAVASAMGETGGGSSQVIENVLNLDGETIYRNQQKIASNKGITLGTTAFQRG